MWAYTSMEQLMGVVENDLFTPADTLHFRCRLCNSSCKASEKEQHFASEGHKKKSTEAPQNACDDTVSDGYYFHHLQKCDLCEYVLINDTPHRRRAHLMEHHAKKIGDALLENAMLVQNAIVVNRHYSDSALPSLQIQFIKCIVAVMTISASNPVPLDNIRTAINDAYGNDNVMTFRLFGCSLKNTIRKYMANDILMDDNSDECGQIMLSLTRSPQSAIHHATSNLQNRRKPKMEKFHKFKETMQLRVPVHQKIHQSYIRCATNTNPEMTHRQGVQFWHAMKCASWTSGFECGLRLGKQQKKIEASMPQMYRPAQTRLPVHSQPTFRPPPFIAHCQPMQPPENFCLKTDSAVYEQLLQQLKTLENTEKEENWETDDEFNTDSADEQDQKSDTNDKCDSNAFNSDKSDKEEEIMIEETFGLGLSGWRDWLEKVH